MSRAAVARAHVYKLALAGAELLYDRADILLGDFDYQQLHRLAGLAVYFLEDDLRARNLKLIALAAHSLYENRKMQLAAAGDFKRVCRIRLLNAHTDVRLDLLEQAVSYISRGYELALAARERAVVDHEVHGYRGLIYFYKRHRLDAVG